MSRLMRMIGQNCAQHEACLRLFSDWEKDAGITSGVLPLRLGAALHALVLERIHHGLVEVYPPNTASDQALWNAVLGAFQQHEQFIREWLKSPPQTNEVRRAAPILAGLNYCLSRYPMPVMLSELGASAGFNLLLDRYTLNAGRTLQPADDPIVTLSPDWMGVIPAQQPLKIIDRAGVDINPLNPVDRLDYLRLLSYTWADQCDRLDRIKQIAPHQTTTVEQADAVDWLPNRLSKQRNGTFHFVFHTIALQYFPQESKDKIAHALAQAGECATPEQPLGYMSMEITDDLEGARLTLQLWPGGQVHDVGRADFHGRWVSWVHPT
jgi:hypothetical protein